MMYDQVSVVIPAYKAEKFILRTIESVLIQKGVEVEIVVIEDGVFDNTRAVLSKYINKITLITLENNKGAQFARNKGLELSTSDFVLFLDADDFFEGENFLRGLYDSMIRHQSDLVFGKGIKRWDNGKEQVFFEAVKSETQEEMVIRWLIGRAGPSPCSILWRTSAIKKIGGWNEHYTKNQDGELVLRALLSDLKVSLSNIGAGIYWQYEGERVSKRMSNEAFECQERLYWFVKKRIQNLKSRDNVAYALNYYLAGVIARALSVGNTFYVERLSDIWQRKLPKLNLIKYHGIRMYTTHVLYYFLGIKLTRKFIEIAKSVR